MVEAVISAEERKTKEQEIEAIVDDLKVIKDDKSSMTIVRAVTQAMAARCLLDMEG